MIAAITFDFWDTLVVDDADEVARAAAGLLPKPAAREALFVAEIAAHHPHLSRARVVEAFSACNAWARDRWKNDQVTPTVAARIAEAMRHLRLPPTPGFGALVLALEQMEVDIPPRLVDGVAEILPILAQTWRIGIISDTIVTPGRGLREILAQAGLLSHFLPAALIFSDEIGVSKPHPAIFAAALAGLELPAAAVVHVGDRAANDVDGPLAAGMRAIRFTGVVDRGPGVRGDDACCARFVDLPSIVSSL